MQIRFKKMRPAPSAAKGKRELRAGGRDGTLDQSLVRTGVG